MLLLLGFSFLAGIFTALSPCILPVLPAILTAGIAEGRLRPLGTIFGLICSFSFFTLTLSWIVHTTGLSPAILRYVAIGLIFFFGLVMIFPTLSNWRPHHPGTNLRRNRFHHDFDTTGRDDDPGSRDTGDKARTFRHSRRGSNDGQFQPIRQYSG